MINAEAWFNIVLRPRKPEGSLGRTAQDGHLDSHTAPELADDGGKEGKETKSRCAWANKTTTTFQPTTTADVLAADWLCRRGVEGRVQQAPYSARDFVDGSQELAPQLTGHVAS